MVFTYVYLLPVTIFVVMPATFLLTYMISVSLGHVNPGLPYISDTGTYSPESCIFSQMTNLTALLFFINSWVRYGQVKNVYDCDRPSTTSLRLLNKISYGLGIVCSIGTSIVSNFQETNIIVVHFLGGILCFGPGIIYVWIQAVISYRTNLCTKKITYIRIVMAILGTIAVFICITCGIISILLFHGQDYSKWKPSDGGFIYHVMSTLAEWILAIGYAGFIVTFVPEYQELYIEPPKVGMESNKAPFRSLLPDPGNPLVVDKCASC